MNKSFLFGFSSILFFSSLLPPVRPMRSNIPSSNDSVNVDFEIYFNGNKETFDLSDLIDENYFVDNFTYNTDLRSVYLKFDGYTDQTHYVNSDDKTWHTYINDSALYLSDCYLDIPIHKLSRVAVAPGMTQSTTYSTSFSTSITTNDTLSSTASVSVSASLGLELKFIGFPIKPSVSTSVNNSVTRQIARATSHTYSFTATYPFTYTNNTQQILYLETQVRQQFKLNLVRSRNINVTYSGKNGISLNLAFLTNEFDVINKSLGNYDEFFLTPIADPFLTFVVSDAFNNLIDTKPISDQFIVTN